MFEVFAIFESSGTKRVKFLGNLLFGIFGAEHVKSHLCNERLNFYRI